MREEVELENNLSEHISWKKPIHICSLFKLKLLWVALTRHILHNLACVARVARVSVWFRSTERQTNGTLGFGRARNETRAKKWKRGEGEGEEGKRGQTIYWSIITADESIKCRCTNSGMTDQVGSFQTLEVCLPAFPSFLPHPLPAVLLAPFFARSLTLGLVPCSLLLNRTETLAT